jgi:hypothetical protein
MDLFSGMLMALKGVAALVIIAGLRHRLAPQALQHDPGLAIGSPLASFHG